MPFHEHPASVSASMDQTATAQHFPESTSQRGTEVFADFRQPVFAGRVVYNGLGTNDFTCHVTRTTQFVHQAEIDALFTRPDIAAE